MEPPVQHWTDSTSDYESFDHTDDDVAGELFAGERIGNPLDRKRGSRWLSWSIALLIAAGGGWLLLDDYATLPVWLSGQSRAVTPAPETKAPLPAQAAATDVPLLPAAKVIEPPVAPVAAAVVPAAPTAAPAESTNGVEPLAPPTVDETNPYQKRAAAVGLHPGVSAAVLQRLSATDYRNAGIAIQKAIAEALDTEIFVWPKQRAPELALFQVRFVPGSNADCRRYVVNVTKDGWSTTAPAMEKCGVRRVEPKAKPPA